MISIKQLKNKLQNDLNDSENSTNINSPLGVSFKLFSDTGKYKKAHRSQTNINEIQQYINGIFSVTSSNISNASNGLEYGTVTARVELIVKCNEEQAKVQEVENSQGEIVEEVVKSDNEQWIENVRTYLDEMFVRHTYDVMPDKDNFSYEVSINYSMAISGQRNQVVGVGDSYTFVFFVYYNIVKSGENSRRYQIYLDNKVLPYGVLTIRRVPTQTANVYSGQTKAIGKSINDNTILGVSIECPAFVSETNDTIKNYILNGENNVAHFLTLKLNGVEQNYLVLFGETDATAQGILNVGLMVSFVETIEEYGIISFPNNCNLYQNDTQANIAFSNDKTIFNITKREFLNVVSAGDIVVSFDKLSGLTQL